MDGSGPISSANGSMLLVPANAIFFPYRPRSAHLLLRPQTTGLAAGLTRSEAVSRASAECIERDSLSLALLAVAKGRQPSPSRLIDLGTLPEVPRALARRFLDAGLNLAVRELPYGPELAARGKSSRKSFPTHWLPALSRPFPRNRSIATNTSYTWDRPARPILKSPSSEQSSRWPNAVLPRSKAFGRIYAEKSRGQSERTIAPSGWAGQPSRSTLQGRHP